MKFTAHIGLGKTGTSAIQTSLNDYEGALNTEENWSWPILANGRKVDHEWLDSPHSAEKTKLLYDTIVAHSKKTGCDHVIWSNEAISNNDKMLELFKELIKWDDDLEVNIIVYVREPGKWLKSAWDQWGLIHKVLPSKPVQWAISGNNLPTFNNWFINWGRGIYKSYLKWEDIADVRLYKEGEDVIDDFSEAVGIDLLRVRAYETLTSAEVLSRAVYNNTYIEPVPPKKFDAYIYKNRFREGGINEFAKTFFELPNIKKKMRVLLNNSDGQGGRLFKDPDMPQERTLSTDDYKLLLDQAIIFSIEAIGRIDQLEDKVKELYNKLDDSP